MPRRGPLEIHRTNDRTFLANYDSVEQADLYAAWRAQDELGPDHLVRNAVARLRLETLLSEKLVFTDVQLFDGAIFMALALADKLHWLSRSADRSRPLPIEIRARETALEPSLWSTYVGPAGPRRFRPAALPDGERVCEELIRLAVPSTAPEGLSGCVELLGLAGADAARLAEVEEAWRRTVGWERDGRLRVVRWSGDIEQLWDDSVEFRPVADFAEAFVRTAAGKDALREVVALRTARSQVYVRLNDRYAAADDDVRRELDLVLSWYNETYRRAQGFQHEADYRGFAGELVDPVAVRHLYAGRYHGRSAGHILTVGLPAGMVDFLGDWEPAYWQEFQQRQMRSLRRWWTEGDVDALRAVTAALIKECQDWGYEKAGVESSSKTFGSKKFVSLFAKLVTGEVGVALDPGPVGFTVAAVLVLAETALERLAARSTRPRSVEVTSYYDDTAGG